MTSKIYKTARGKVVDMGKLLLQNERVRAVGNKPVNARGDRIDAFNNVIEPKNEQTSRSYRQSNVSNQPITKKDSTPVPEEKKLTPDVDVTSGEFLNVTAPPPVTTDPTVTGGLASALKRAKKDSDD